MVSGTYDIKCLRVWASEGSERAGRELLQDIVVMMSVVVCVVTFLVDGVICIRIWVLSMLFCFGPAEDRTFLVCL